MAEGGGSVRLKSRLAGVLHPVLSLGCGSAVGGAAWLAGAMGPAVAAVLAILAAAALHGAIGTMRFRADRRRLVDAQRLLLDEVLALRARLTDAETRLEQLPASQKDGMAADGGSQAIWRGVAADIDVLGTLVRDLAKNVADHERRLGEQAGRELVESYLQDTVESAGLPPPPVTTAPLQSVRDMAPALQRPPAPVAVAEPVPGPGLASRVPPLDRSRMRTMLSAALRSDHLELCLLPVVSLPQRKTIGYRANLRIKPGEEGIFGQDAGLAVDIRRLALLAENSVDHDVRLIQRALQVLRVLRARNRSVTITCRVARASLTSASFIPELRLASAGDVALTSALRLELAAFDMTALGAIDPDIGRHLAAAGVQLALTDIGSLRLDPPSLAAMGVTQVDIAADLLTGQTQVGAGDIRGEDLAGLFGRAGISVLASGVQTEDVVPELIDIEVGMASGPVFGEARPVRAEVLEPTPVAPEPVAEPERPVVAASGRQSFRSMLRRA